MQTLARLGAKFDVEETTRRIVVKLRDQVMRILGRRGVVLGLSGGVDSSVCAALATRAVGEGRVLALFMPERDSDPSSQVLAGRWATRLGIEQVVEDITPVLSACSAYERRDRAIRRLVADFGDGWKCKIVLPSGRMDADRLNVFTLVVQSPGGQQRRVRLPPQEYRDIVAATNFKQRIRKMFEYYHADRRHYAVLGTPNRLEYDQGFFVKGGDGLADVKPIAHLYKSQVYALAEYLGVPREIRERPPTTDTYSLEQSQEEFYFTLPTETLDELLWSANAGWDAKTAAEQLSETPERVARAYREIERKRLATRYLHTPPLLIEPVREVRPEGAAL